MNSFIPIKPGKYKDVWFESAILPFVCKGNLTLINCKCNQRLFVTNNLIACNSEFIFLDVAKKFFAKTCTITEYLSSCDETYLSDIIAKNVLIIGDLKLAQTKIENLKHYSGQLKLIGKNEINNYDNAEEIVLREQLNFNNRQSYKQYI